MKLNETNRPISFATALLVVTILLCLPAMVVAQGSIFGLVSNSNFTVPAEGELSFVGFLDDTDEEIRVEFCDGAGYSVGNWYDDYQNYFTEGAGNPSDFLFYNSANAEGFHLSLSIPNNSFQQADVQLQAVAWPSRVGNIRVTRLDSVTAEIRWNYVDGINCHIYRRHATSNGSFFRIDNPSGNLLDPGVADSVYVDSGLTPTLRYDYLLIAEDQAGQWSAHSDPVTVSGSACCQLRGNANSRDGVDISDLTFIVDFMFGGGPPASCVDEADFDFSGTTDISDLTFMVDFLFGGGPAPPPC